MIHPLAYIIQDNIIKVNKLWYLLLKLSLVSDIESYKDKYFHSLRYTSF
jgi:hypothetical protein